MNSQMMAVDTFAADVPGAGAAGMLRGIRAIIAAQ
jgi:hypothetical protein